MPGVDPEKREAFLEYMLKEHQEDAETIIYKMTGEGVKIPFMSPMLTWATTGGAKMGHFCRWYGPEGSGKSLTNAALIAVAQNYPEYISEWYEIDIKFLERAGKALAAKKKAKELKSLVAQFPDGMEAIIFDTEQRIEPRFMEANGVDMSRVPVINNNITEEIIKDATVAAQAFHIIIIDSATNAQSIAEASLEPGEFERGQGPKAWSRLKQFRRAMSRTENLLIIVDQVRAQGLGGGKMHRGPETAPPNVRFLRHNASLAIEYSPGRKLYLDKNHVLTDQYDKASNDIRSLGTDGKEPHGLEMKCKVIKNSTGKPDRSARMRFRMPVYHHRTGEAIQDVGFDTNFELLEIAQHFDIMELSGARFYPLDEDFNRIPKKGKTDVSYNGQAQAMAAFDEDEELRERVIARLQRDIR